MAQTRTQLVTYIVSIIVVNVIFIYLRVQAKTEQERKTIVMFHVFFGVVQLVLIGRKVMKDRSKTGDSE
jgi:uncharacterized membrane protein